MALKWTPEVEAAVHAELEALMFETIERVLKEADEYRKKKALEVITKNIMEMAIDIPDDVSHRSITYMPNRTLTLVHRTMKTMAATRLPSRLEALTLVSHGRERRDYTHEY